MVYLCVDFFPLFTGLYALIQGFHARLDVAIEYSVQINLLTASSDDFIAQLKQVNHINMRLLRN